jgi:NAD(P)-dependent dehydrogenase (short-subunit alcohol dehydrogenase family)
MAPSVTRIALVTGANKGIGLEIARQLGKSGLFVFVGARNPALGEVASERLRDEGVDAHYVQVDLTEPATITAAAADIESRGAT